MGSSNIIVREYLESLKEDTELDYLFPILLNLMGFRIITTAAETKGQSQYGKDIVAIGKDDSGIVHRYYFELKGYDAKDITDSNYSVKDGVRESIIEAKDTAFNDSSIPTFNHLPVKIVFVHNGTIKGNIRITFEGFITREFPNGGFERWDIYHLTDLFSKYLFSESLLTDENSIRLFKKTLLLLDAPENDFSDFRQLVDSQLLNFENLKGRSLKKLFATLNLLSVIILHYSKENDNLYPARDCLTYLILKVWAWILKNNLENRESILNEFRKLLKIHFTALQEYFRKTIPSAVLENGLFAENGGSFEEVGYPLRCMDFLDYLIYFFHARTEWPLFKVHSSEVRKRNLFNHQKKLLFKIIKNNDGCTRPIIDNHSIPILNVCLFILKNHFATEEDILFVGRFLNEILDNIMIVKTMKKRLPELYNNTVALTEYCATGERPHEYRDSSSLLITIIFEILALLDEDDVYQHYRLEFDKDVNLQIAFPSEEIDIEQTLFERNLHNDMYVETNIKLPEKIADLKKRIQESPKPSMNFRTDNAGFSYLRILANSYFKNEHFPEDWREGPHYKL